MKNAFFIFLTIASVLFISTKTANADASVTTKMQDPFVKDNYPAYDNLASLTLFNHYQIERGISSTNMASNKTLYESVSVSAKQYDDGRLPYWFYMLIVLVLAIAIFWDDSEEVLSMRKQYKTDYP